LNGNILGHNSNSSLCTSFDFKHEEFACLDERSSSLLPSRVSREQAQLPFSLFTILRHPIDRIGAQAFYGNGVGASLVIQNIYKHCLQNTSFTSFNLNAEFHRCRQQLTEQQGGRCSCFYHTLNETFHTLRTNETLWFNWFTSPGYGDSYMSNYFIKRLVGGFRATRPRDEETSVAARECLLNQTKDCTGQKLLQELLPSVRCSVDSLSSNMTLARIKAEDLLERQYDFSILEHFSDPSAPFFFQSLLRERDVELIRGSLAHSRTENVGFIGLLPPGHAPARSSSSRSPSSLKYASFFPKPVLAFLLADNAEDIALYHSAVKIYHHRIERLMAQLGLRDRHPFSAPAPALDPA
jgi:hypothetical protein